MLKAVLFDFNGIIINDKLLHEQLIEQILIEENLRPQPGEFRQVCLGKSDRACLKELLTRRSRVLSESYLTQLVNHKTQAYQQQVKQLEKLPLYPGLKDLIFQLRAKELKLAVVSNSLLEEVKLVLDQAKLAEYFQALVAVDEVITSEPELDGYFLAVERLNQLYPDLNLQMSECLAIEHTPIGIEAAQRAGMQAVGVAHTYPFHMLQRLADWTVDYLCDLEVERVQEAYSWFETGVAQG
ncbi:MAG: HAD family phosphatase [Chroococcidiopsidaceae cyanobacterium CP_BM_ER_R8_30]|nr:HAD family phosphatase [Chroococcidiopsidaceae cyanobacterium CP_BM_ER_R8_30]